MIKKAGVAIIAMYMFTWIGAWGTEAYYMSRTAESYYAHGQEIGNSNLLEGGPDWSVLVVPIVPFVTYTESKYIVGPSHAAGSSRVCIWYGLGEYPLWVIESWIA